MRFFRRAIVAMFLCGWLMVAGCYRLPSTATSVPMPEPTTTATDEEAQAAAAALETAVRSGDRSRAMQEFALEVVGHRVVTGLPVSPDRLPELLKLLPARADTNQLVALIVNNSNQVGGFRLLQIRPADGRHVARFRLGLGDSQVHYFDVTFARFPSGRIGVEDLVDLNDGTRLTDDIRQEILPAATLRDPSLADRVRAEDRLYLAHSAKIDETKRALADHRWKDAKKLFEDLPAGLRDQKPTRFGYAWALVRGGAPQADQMAALAACREQFPNDPATDLLAMDLLWMQKEYSAAGRAVAALRKSIGEDAVLAVIEAGTLAKTGQLKAAAAAAERGVRADPELKEVYATRIVIALEAEDHAATLEWLKRAVEHTGMHFRDLQTIPIYAKFVKSPEYQLWLIWTANRPGT